MLRADEARTSCRAGATAWASRSKGRAW